MGATCEPDRFPGPLFFLSLALLGASGSGNRIETSRPNREMKNALQMNARVRELVALSSFAALGCGLAAVHSNLLFVALFGVVSVFTSIEAIRSR